VETILDAFSVHHQFDVYLYLYPFSYRSEYLMFNDDIQGTAATVLAGLYGALKVQGLEPEALSKQKFVVCGAGSAASGVLLTIRNAITRR
jgi:malic enzyme